MVNMNIKTGEFRRVTNRCMVSWIVALCITMMLMMVINSTTRWPPPQQQQKRQQAAGSSSVAGWLQAAQPHVQTLAELGTPTAQHTPRIQSSPKPLLDASNITKPPLYPPGFRLSNLNNFTFVINNDVCGSDPVDMVMVVTSDTRQPTWRAAIRSALPSAVLAELRIRRVFLLAELAPPANTSADYDRRVAALQAENYEHADLVVGSFRDAYRNLTYKHLMGLHWASTYCPQAHYIIKMDHDIAVDVFQLHRRLMTAPVGYRDTNTLIGAVFGGTDPIRDVNNKWYVTQEEFAEKHYPEYMSGWLYLITPDAAARLVAATVTQPFFWVDDVYVTGVLRERAARDIHMIDFDRLFGYRDAAGKSYSPFTMQITCIYECAAEAQASVSQCNTIIGPVWNNRVVMRLFFKHAEHCYRHGCERRSPMPAKCANGGGGGDERQSMPQAEQDIGDITS